MPYIDSPFKKPEIWTEGSDCFFLDADEATQAQLNFIAKIKRLYPQITEKAEEEDPDTGPYEFRADEPVVPYETEFTIPKKFQHVDIEKVYEAETKVDELLSVLNKVHPWSSLHYGLSASDVVKKLYLDLHRFDQGQEIGSICWNP